MKKTYFKDRKMTLTLIGLPASGKSTLGVLLAKALGLKFIDCDLVIQEKTGKLLHEIIAEKGVENFLALEEEINCEIFSENAIISTGGSAVYSQRAMKHFKSLGKVLYIKIDYDTLKERLGDYSHRGIAQRQGETLLDMYNERVPLYEKWADVTQDSLDTMSETVTSLIRTVSEQI